MTNFTKIVAPTNCPSCGAELVRVNAQLFCENSKNCPAQCAKKLQSFCSKLKLKGWGEATLAKLELESINDILFVDPQKFGFSEKVTTNLKTSLEQRIAQGITPAEFISAMSIPLIGDSIARKLESYEIDEITHSVCKQEKLGDKATANLLEWIDVEWPQYRNTWRNLLTTTTKRQESNYTVCITGKLQNFKNRTEASKYLESLGVEVKSTVTKSLSYLICEEEDKTSSSCVKASGYNIPILTIKELEEVLKHD